MWNKERTDISWRAAFIWETVNYIIFLSFGQKDFPLFSLFCQFQPAKICLFARSWATLDLKILLALSVLADSIVAHTTMISENDEIALIFLCNILVLLIYFKSIVAWGKKSVFFIQRPGATSKVHPFVRVLTTHGETILRARPWFLILVLFVIILYHWEAVWIYSFFTRKWNKLWEKTFLVFTTTFLFFLMPTSLSTLLGSPACQFS